MITATTAEGITRTICETEDDWLGERLCSVGASETPSLIGIGFAGTNAATVWESKVRPQWRSNDEIELLQLGQVMEPAIREACRRLRKMEVIDPIGREIWRNTAFPRMHATPDGFVVERGEQGVLELKNVSGWNADEWADGEAAPLRVQAQVQHQLACTGLRFGYAAGLIGGSQLRVVRIERDEAFVMAIRECVAHFWTYVEREEVPPVMHDNITLPTLKRLHPDDNGETVSAPLQLTTTLDRLVKVKALKSRLKTEEELLESRICNEIGDATYVQFEDGRTVSWRTISQKEKFIPAYKYRRVYIHKSHPDRKRKSR